VPKVSFDEHSDISWAVAARFFDPAGENAEQNQVYRKHSLSVMARALGTPNQLEKNENY